jgi:hypothetical protein
LLVWGDRDAFTGRTEQEFLVREILRGSPIDLCRRWTCAALEDPRRVAGELVALISSRNYFSRFAVRRRLTGQARTVNSTRARLIMTTDLQGHALSGATAEAAAYYDQAVEAFNIYRGDPIASLTHATRRFGLSRWRILRATCWGLNRAAAVTGSRRSSSP